jgi:23S rRNA pseudouridine1911/1915/1917 synthase
MYGGRHSTERQLGGERDDMLLARQALHATTLGFRHPMNEAPMKFTAPLAGDLKRAVELLRAASTRQSRAVEVNPPGATIDLAATGL